MMLYHLINLQGPWHRTNNNFLNHDNPSYTDVERNIPALLGQQIIRNVDNLQRIHDGPKEAITDSIDKFHIWMNPMPETIISCHLDCKTGDSALVLHGIGGSWH
jgi:hypothetical protein